MTHLSLQRASVLALGLVPVLSSLVAPVRASFGDAERAPIRWAPRVPYPVSVLVVERILGGEEVHPSVTASRYPGSYLGRPAYDPHEAAELLLVLFLATRRQQEEVERLREVAWMAAGFSRGQVRPLDPDIRPRLEAIEEIARTTRYQGLHPLLGEVPEVYLFQRQPGLEPLTLELAATDLGALGLSMVNLDTISLAQAWLDSIDAALEQVVDVRQHLVLAEQLLQLEPVPGLEEVGRTLRLMRPLAEQAADSTLNTGDRRPLDLAFQADLERLTRAGELTSFLAQPLLEGGEAWLESAGGGYLHIRLPDLPSLSGAEVGAVSGAERALETMDVAIELVQEERARMAELLSVLQQQVVHLEPR